MNHSPALASFAPAVGRSNSFAPTAASSAALRRLTIAINAQSLGGGDELPAPRDREEDPDVVPVHRLSIAQFRVPEAPLFAARCARGCATPHRIAGNGKQPRTTQGRDDAK